MELGCVFLTSLKDGAVEKRTTSWLERVDFMLMKWFKEKEEGCRWCKTGVEAGSEEKKGRGSK